MFLVLAWGTCAQAATTLSLEIPNGLQGTVVQGSLTITTDASIAGVNAEIILPAGVTVNGVQKGALLIPAAGYELDFQLNGSNLRVIVWSAAHTFTNTGAVLNLLLQLNAGLLGLQAVDFASVNPVPQINSRHALSNNSGSQSLAHTVANATFLAYSANSDYDSDGMPDAWEDQNGLDPLIDNGNADADNDGYTDLEEYQSGTDPQDPLSNPEMIFVDSFETPP